MDKLSINGGNTLHGEVAISGSKNASLPILCSSLLTSDSIALYNIPHLNDISTTLNLLNYLGVKHYWNKNDALILQSNQINCLEAPYELVKTMRASILVLGPLLSRFGEAHISLPGGCSIGQRPVDQHLKGLSALGADIRLEHGFVVARAKKLRGSSIRTDMMTVTGTENLMMAATLAKGQTILENAACEPEIVDLAELLNKMGASIKGYGTNRIIIDGVDQLHGAEHKVSPDRIEAGTFLCAVCATGGDIILHNVILSHMGSTVDKLIQAGLNIQFGDNWIKASMKSRPKAVGFRTSEYPGFATDMQAQLMALNTIAKGSALIVENIFENRYMHVQELQRLGANIEINGHSVVVHGVKNLSGAIVRATDLRASASLVIAGLIAKDETLIERIYHLDRGYDSMDIKLRNLGANIQRVTVDRE
ncbi:MAG: UDP-N-acetylglucosamine 1-carboxyvinyltransferase [Bordetella sp.]|nr:MAG: UDP-N-acetylglucosamine 1-carboxyvinyltransferase [Bordetella sp.]